MFAKTGLTLVLPAAAVAVVVAGCGSSGTTSAGTSGTTPPASASVPATVTDTVVPPATTTTATAGTTVSPTATGPVACATANLTVSIGAPEGAAGSEIYPLHFTNKAAAACTITAYPGVSFVAPGNGSQVGVAAVRATGVPTPTITLSSGAEATAQVKVAEYQNFPASACASTAISGFRVYPPDNKTAAYVTIPGATKACTKASQLQVQPVVAGANG
jgi:hypothetical protein